MKLENLEALREKLEAYTHEHISEEIMRKTLDVDTKLHHHELSQETVHLISQFAPFGEGNEEPLFLIEDMTITNVEKVGKTGTGHMKLHVSNVENGKFHALFRGEGDQIDKVEKGISAKLVGRIRKDDFNGGVYIDGKKRFS